MVTANGRLNSEAKISTSRILSDIKTVWIHQKVVDIFECGTLAFAIFHTCHKITLKSAEQLKMSYL